jgi:C4-dicarboxylate-binding protein DctP
MRLMRRIATTVAASVLLCSAAEPASRQLRVALHLPRESHLYENLDLFKRAVEKGTNGALEIVIAHSGQLIKEQDAPEAVATGVVEMASVQVNHYGGVIPAADLFVEPFMFVYPPVLTAATRPGSPVRAPIDQAILERTGARVLWWQSNGAAVMVSKDAPLTTPAAIASKAVRVSTASEGEFIRACGGIPRVISGAAYYEAYQTGQVIAGSSSIAAVAARELWKVTNFVTFSRHRTSEFVVTINERLWQSLPAEHRRAIEAAAKNAEAAVSEQILTIEREALALAEKNGMTLVEMTTADWNQWKYCAAPMLDAYLDRSGPLGAQVLSGYRQLLVEAYRKAPPEPGQDRRQYSPRWPPAAA